MEWKLLITTDTSTLQVIAGALGFVLGLWLIGAVHGVSNSVQELTKVVKRKDFSKKPVDEVAYDYWTGEPEMYCKYY